MSKWIGRRGCAGRVRGTVETRPLNLAFAVSGDEFVDSQSSSGYKGSQCALGHCGVSRNGYCDIDAGLHKDHVTL